MTILVLTTRLRAIKKQKTLKNMLGNKDKKMNSRKRKFNIDQLWLSQLLFLQKEWQRQDCRNLNHTNKS